MKNGQPQYRYNGKLEPKTFDGRLVEPAKLQPGDVIPTEIGDAAVMRVVGDTGLNRAYGPVDKIGLPAEDSRYTSFAQAAPGVYLVPALPNQVDLIINAA